VLSYHERVDEAVELVRVSNAHNGAGLQLFASDIFVLDGW
jgi:hypothetical protein